MSAIVINDQIIHYEVLGRGRPIILLHGWVGSWRYWIPTMQAASISYRAYALDLWGFGDSAKASDQYNLESQSDLISQFMDNMGIGKIALLGHGLGAIVALLFAQNHPGDVDRIMAVEYPFSDDAIHSRVTTATPDELANWLLDRSSTGNPAANSEASKTDPVAINTSVAQIQTLNPFKIAMQLTTPCLFVHGQKDPAVAAPSNSIRENSAAHMHHILFDASGHFPMLDEPSKFNRLLTDFLTLPSGESPQQLQLKEEWKRRVR